MRVFLDGTPLAVPAGGIARYTAELSVALANEFPADEYWLVSDQPFSLAPPQPANLHCAGRKRGVFGRRWWSCGVAAAMLESSAELFHGTDFAVPYLPLRPSVLTLHDLSPWRDAAWQAASPRVRRRTPFLIGLGLATMIITPTEAIRREAIDKFRLHPSRIVSVPLAAAAHFRPAGPEPAPAPYFLYVGALEARKNISLLLEAWREVRRSHPVELVLAGRARPGFRTPAPEPGLRLLGETRDADLPALYSGAVAFLYPSLYEGFGLPVLEAMSCGTAVIASRDPAIAEVAGDGALLLEAGGAAPWVEAMKAVLSEPVRRTQLRERALRRSRDFSWARTARRTREVYLEARRRFGN